MPSKIPFKNFERLLSTELKGLTKTAKVLAVNHFKESFINQGFTDGALEPWEETKTKKAKEEGKSEGILVQTGALKRAIVGKVNGLTIEISNEMPYAQIHNEGGMINATAKIGEHQRKIYKVSKKGKKKNSGTTTVKAHSRKINFKMEQRQFIGNSEVLNNLIKAEADKRLINLFASLEIIKQ